mmetsp:Transcript_26452/g.32005  ORF Transcript_26452/g.32005 Transcript_26452/m.32005 type:complete len:398 (-) Transcript_26452:165-1358(-)|eukprot:CAMPEP_0172490472 /NCGR_PEP_ID=MMETSP1066-20121228/20895_1 /TAXON_ID=671091 /ORGANISM="Coscinodiscus wailesii, Strain CCMP2513" /LENGTH=397 /DNA_ID=CAMNT_0013258949 /DNA_START=54 /DNA_END=1247 /DNA_ORIENTATION=-
MTSTFIISAKRTPFGSFGGSLKNLSPTELGAIATKAALSAISLPPDLISGIYFGNVLQTTPDSPYMSRHIGLMSGIPPSTPALTVNRLCGSGFESVVQGDLAIRGGLADCVVCGGSENMSGAPFSLDGNKVRWGVGLGQNVESVDRLWSGVTDSYANVPMGITAENLAEKYGITREECDEYAIRSQKAWGEAKQSGQFDFEMAPVEIETRKGTEIIDTDEHPRPETTLEKIQKLKPVFKKNGVVTAANASGICDGAGTILLASEKFITDHDITPLARLASFGIVGCDPTIMGIGPVGAIRQALSQTSGVSLHNDVAAVEINEAFAAQYLACEKELELDRNRCNVHGGAISLGHPLGASGSRILAHLVGRVKGNSGEYVVGAACIGGGQGIAVLLEGV